MTDTMVPVAADALDHRDPVLRLAHLLDPGSVDLWPRAEQSNVQVAAGRIDGVPAYAYCTDGRRTGGAIGAAEAGRIAAAIDAAAATGAPVVGLWHSGGAQLSEGVLALDGIGRMFAAMIGASGRIPQVSVVLGPAAGGAAYGPALTDVVVMGPAAKGFVPEPEWCAASPVRRSTWTAWVAPSRTGGAVASRT